MRALIVIPARHASARFPGKPLAMLRGATGEPRSLIERSWEAAVLAAGSVAHARVVVATDDAGIREHCEGFGAEVVMTSEACRNGTERCAAVLDALGDDWDAVVNLQGDAPLTPPSFVEALLGRMERDAEVAVATPVLRASEAAEAALRADRGRGLVGATTAVAREDGSALYFSKEVLPFSSGAAEGVLHHVGVYAYRPGALRDYASWPMGALERAEGLEQLRFLERGVSVACVPVEAPGRPFWEVNHPEDVARVEAILVQVGLR